MNTLAALRRVVARTGLAVLASGLFLACGPNAAGIALTVQSIDKSIVKLEVKPTVGGKALPSEFFGDLAGAEQVQLGFQLPSAYVGQPVKFQVDGLDSANCRRQTSSLELSTDAIRRYDAKIALGGLNPQPITANLFAVHGAGPNDVWAVGGSGAVLHYTGCAWEQHTPFTSAGINSVYAAPGPGGGPSNAVYALTDSSIYKWDGSAWTKEQTPSLPAGAALRAIHGAGANDVWAVAAFAGNPSCIILHRNASAWELDVGCFSTALNSIRTYTLSSVYAISATGAIVGGGESAQPKTGTWSVGTWRSSPSSMAPGQSGDVASVWGTSLTDYWAGGEYGALQHYTQGGWTLDTAFQSFFPSGTGTSKYFVYRMHGVAANDFWAVSFTTMPTYTSRIAHYTGSWKLETQLNTEFTQLGAVWAAAANDVWFVGYAGVRVHYDGTKFAKAMD